MVQAKAAALENNFTAGLKTEFTGLNFPPNACTETFDCSFELTGDVLRRHGFDFELNYEIVNEDVTGKAISSYRWLNAGGDGLTQLLVVQIGSLLYFYKSSDATDASPLSAQQLIQAPGKPATTISLVDFLPSGSVQDPSIVECQYADGNGFLFVFHPNCDPFSVEYNDGLLNPKKITVSVRDFMGLPEPGVPVDFRPTILTDEHSYNLQNQGWTNATTWTSSVVNPNQLIKIDNGIGLPLGSNTFTVASGLGATQGTFVNISYSATVNFYLVPDVQFHFGGLSGTATGTVTSYSGTTLVVNVSANQGGQLNAGAGYEMQYIAGGEQISISSTNLINTVQTWHTATGNYPSNADVWYNFKNSTGAFSPATTINNIGLPTSPAAKGHFILEAFNQQQGLVSGIASLTPVVTDKRPRTGSWYAGRVWYTGVDDSQSSTGDQDFYTWTENIYFTQIIQDITQFGKCYQTDDPTNEDLFLLLPSDGGVITIQGSGSIYKLFPIQNGMLVFAANGIWFITGSTGIGFTANDYTVTKISNVRSLSSTSYINVNGLPVFWNEEDIYTIAPAQQGLGLTVSPLCVGTILSFYQDIPRESKRFARGSYDPISYIIQWIYKSTPETDITDRYRYDRVLNLNTYTRAFYPYTITAGLVNGVQAPYVHDVQYISNPGGTNAPDPIFKYLCSNADGLTFAEENDPSYVDWDFATETDGLDYNSYFITGYKLDGQGLRKFQPEYLYMYSRNELPTSYSIQGMWNFANNRNSGKWSNKQLIVNNKPNFGMVFRRHRVRGHGYALQFKVASVNGQPFDIMGWSVYETQNTGV